MNILMECTDQELVESATMTVIDALRNSKARPKGPILLPTAIDKYVVIRHGRKRETFEVRTHCRLIRLDAHSTKAMENLVSIGLPAGVEIKITGT